MNIRKVTVNDAQAICQIYNYYIENTVITFETMPVSEPEMQERIRHIVESGYCYYAGEIAGKLIGFYYTHPWNYRQAYYSTCEVAIYLNKDETGKGYGSRLFEHLMNHIDREKIHVLISGICVPNESSIRLHEKFGFKQVSLLKEIGRKFDRWRDVGHWQLVFDSPSQIN